MKKTLIILFAIFLLFTSACERAKNTKDNLTTSTNNEHTLSDLVENTSSVNHKTEINDTVTQSTEKEKEILNSTSKEEKSSQKENNNAAPYIITVDLNDLIQIKSATESMNEADFVEYMNNNFPNEVINGMTDLSQTKLLLSELEASYIPLLDGDKSNFSTISFYIENNEFHQLTYFSEKRRIVAYVNTSKNAEQSDIMFENIENAVTVKNIETDTYSARIYTVENKNHYYVDLFIDDTYIFLRTHDIETIEEFEADFARLKFVKIGDLLNE